MKIAFISDVHGNLVALKAVLSEIEVLKVDEIVFLGDLCTLGPKPNETAELLLSKCSRFILGNHDEYLFNEESLQSYTDQKIILDSVYYARNEISEKVLQEIKTFSPTLEIESESGSLLCYHGSPISNSENIFSETPLEKISSIFNIDKYFLFIGGHTHIQMVKRIGHASILNSGSVGQPFKSKSTPGIPELLPHAEFLILTIKGKVIQYELIQVNYDIKLHVDQILESKLPLKWWLKDQYKL